MLCVLVLALVLALAGGRKRLRREIRSLPAKEWKTVVAAMHVMKVVPQAVGLSIYGRHFRSYDSLVLQHSQASLYGPGDAAHFSEVFPIFHRAWTLAFENSLLAVDPSILGLPYWNFALDQDPSSGATSVFSNQYFGGSGDPTDGFTVTDGPFAYWPIADSSTLPPEAQSSVFGLLRHPLSINNNPFLTRRIGSLCGIQFEFGDSSSYSKCSNLGANISEFRLCIDPTIHGPAHLAIGGSWQRDSQRGQKDSTSCSQWYGQISPQAADPSTPLPPLGSFISAYTAGCFKCREKKCSLSDNPDACVCARQSNKPKSCGPLWTGLANDAQYKATLSKCKHTQIIGDFVDAVCSPNDPIFPFHHANIDRIFSMWLERFDEEELSTLEYFKYPTKGLAYGSNLHDILSPPYPFVNLVESYPLDDSPYTVYDILAATFPKASCPYKYRSAKLATRSLQFSEERKRAESYEGAAEGGGHLIFLLLVCAPAVGFLVACIYPRSEVDK